LDIHAKTIAVAIAEMGGEVHSLGVIAKSVRVGEQTAEKA